MPLTSCQLRPSRSRAQWIPPPRPVQRTEPANMRLIRLICIPNFTVHRDKGKASPAIPLCKAFIQQLRDGGIHARCRSSVISVPRLFGCAEPSRDRRIVASSPCCGLVQHGYGGPQFTCGHGPAANCLVANPEFPSQSHHRRKGARICTFSGVNPKRVGHSFTIVFEHLITTRAGQLAAIPLGNRGMGSIAERAVPAGAIGFHPTV